MNKEEFEELKGLMQNLQHNVRLLRDQVNEIRAASVPLAAADALAAEIKATLNR